MKCSRIELFVMVVTILIYMEDKWLILACPSGVCVCKWKNGKQTVECGGQILSKIPEGMDPGTQVLNFSGNSLQVLQSERFLRMDLINLQKIYLSRNQLIKIHEKAFRGLSNLVELDLSDNMLQHVPTETFQDYTSLMRLSLSGNPIRELKTSAFRHLAFLTTLELSNCQIEKIENEAFIGMDNLEWLRLDGNRIGAIQGARILPKALHGISLHNNRWFCDCRLIDVHAWLINYNTPLTEEPKCVEPPRLKGQIIKSLKKDELACMPEIMPKSTYTEISEGRNISMMCTVRAIPEAKVLWLFNGQILTNDSFLESLHMYYYIDETGREEKRSEVFIYNIGPEDNGTFSCIGTNTAGTSFSNYTLRVLIKEPPVVKEVSFAKDYFNVILASGGGSGIIVVLLICLIVVKCRHRKPGNKTMNSDTSSNDTGLLKCPSIINEDDMLPKISKENGSIIGGHHMKQNFMMYVATMPQGHIIDDGDMQLNQASISTPPLDGSNGSGGGASGDNSDLHRSNATNMSTQYCSPPNSMRNYQERNPDLINDAESGKNKLKPECGEYEGTDCSADTCSIQRNYDNYYQLPSQFGSQIIRPATHHQRLTAAMSTIPRGMVTAKSGSQHQVDVHLNPICFLGQDNGGCATYDFSNNHLHSSPSFTGGNQQQNYYRTLPHNRGHNKILSSASTPGARYSLEAEFLQRTATPPYDKFVQNIRFTAEGYPIHSIQYPSPPDGYKGDFSLPESLNSGQSIRATAAVNVPACVQPTGGIPSFQQWPPCLPGYHVQPIRYTASVPQVVSSPTTAPCVVAVSATDFATGSSSSGHGSSTVASQQHHHPSPASSTVTSSQTQTATTSTSTLTTEVKKRCVSAQTTELEPATIPECDEEQETSKLRHLSGPLADSPDEGYVGDSQEGSDI